MSCEITGLYKGKSEVRLRELQLKSLFVIEFAASFLHIHNINLQLASLVSLLIEVWFCSLINCK